MPQSFPRPAKKPVSQSSWKKQRVSPLLTSVLIYALILSVFGAAEVKWGPRGFIIAIAAMLFVPAAAAFGAFDGWRKLPTLVRFGMAFFVLICLVQLVPLPPAIWTSLPGNEKREAVLAIAGLGSAWMPMTLTPIASLYGALVAISAVMLTCALVALSQREFRLVLAFTLAAVIVGICIGIVQVTTAGQLFAFYAATDAGALVGAYANKNHMALAMICSVPVASFLSVGSAEGETRRRVAFLGYWAFIMVMVTLTNSRAGILIGLVVSLMLAWPMLSSVGKRGKIAGFSAALAIVAILMFAPLPATLVARLDSVADDLRWPMLLHSFEVWRVYWLFGSGLGSFADVFMAYEKLDWLFPTYVNNVHNDYVQLGIETGVFGLAALALFSGGLAMAIPSGLRSVNPAARAAAIAGLAIVVAFALHSIVDYPLRRPAAIVIFLVGVAALCRAYASARDSSADEQPQSRRRSSPERR